MQAHVECELMSRFVANRVQGLLSAHLLGILKEDNTIVMLGVIAHAVVWQRSLMSPRVLSKFLFISHNDRDQWKLDFPCKESSPTAKLLHR